MPGQCYEGKYDDDWNYQSFNKQVCCPKEAIDAYPTFLVLEQQWCWIGGAVSGAAVAIADCPTQVVEEL
jgi:hypothetical protein